MVRPIYLPDGKNEVVFPLPHKSVDLSRPWRVQVTQRRLLNNLGGDMSDLSSRSGWRKADALVRLKLYIALEKAD